MYITFLLVFLMRILVVLSQEFEVVFEWNYLNFTPAPFSFTFDKSTYYITGTKLYKDNVYVSLPRIRPESRVTLAALPLNSSRTNPLLTPYPSWEANTGDGCDKLQDVMSMEIDARGVMWVIDGRRIDNATACPPKIVLLDLNDNGTTLNQFTIPESLCPDDCYLNDIVVDNDFCYISDSTSSDPGILVYNRVLERAWKARNNKTMKSEANANEVRSLTANINGIALSCEEFGRMVYYSTGLSYNIYSIGADFLQNEQLISNASIGQFITVAGNKSGQTDGMVCSGKNRLYFGLIPNNTVESWDLDEEKLQTTILEQNSTVLKWPDSFAIYDWSLYVLSISDLELMQTGINASNVNFRILKTFIGSNSYVDCRLL